MMMDSNSVELFINVAKTARKALIESAVSNLPSNAAPEFTLGDKVNLRVRFYIESADELGHNDPGTNTAFRFFGVERGRTASLLIYTRVFARCSHDGDIHFDAALDLDTPGLKAAFDSRAGCDLACHLISECGILRRTLAIFPAITFR